MDKKRVIISIIVGIIFVFIIVTFYSTFSLGEDYKIVSDVYRISDGMIGDISPNTSVLLFKDSFDLENCSIKVVDQNNKEITSSYVYSSSKTILYDDKSHVIGEYINVIKGDIFYDGVIDDKDFSEFGKYLVLKGEINDIQKEVMDIDLDGKIGINDLLLLDKAHEEGILSASVQTDNMILQEGERERVIVEVTPNYGVNRNFIWSSSDLEVASVSDSGVVVGKKEGDTTIKGVSVDGNVVVETHVKVDNTIQLSSYEGVGYVGGNDLKIDIKAISYDDITCSSSDSSVGSCSISGKQLVITPLKEGSSDIVVSSAKYGSVHYYFTSYSVYFRVMPNYLCTTPNNVHFITVTGFHQGNLSFSSSDSSVIKEANMVMYQNRNMLKIAMGSGTGRATLTVSEDNGNSSSIVTVDTYQFSISLYGKEGVVGDEMRVDMVLNNTYDLECVSPDPSIATCSIEKNQLVVHPLKKGEVLLKVLNKVTYSSVEYDCGEATFLVVVREG